MKSLTPIRHGNWAIVDGELVDLDNKEEVVVIPHAVAKAAKEFTAQKHPLIDDKKDKSAK